MILVELLILVQVLTHSWSTVATQACDSTQCEVGLEKCADLYVGMLDVTHLASTGFSPTLLVCFYVKPFNTCFNCFVFLTNPSNLQA